MLACSLVGGTTACFAPGHVLQHVNHNLLPPLEPEVEMGALNSMESTSPQDVLRLFRNEIYRNVAEPISMQSDGAARPPFTY